MKAFIEIYNLPSLNKCVVLKYNSENLKLAKHLRYYFNKYFKLHFSNGSQMDSDGNIWDCDNMTLTITDKNLNWFKN